LNCLIKKLYNRYKTDIHSELFNNINMNKHCFFHENINILTILYLLWNELIY
jgi:hypothetical protein